MIEQQGELKRVVYERVINIKRQNKMRGYAGAALVLVCALIHPTLARALTDDSHQIMYLSGKNWEYDIKNGTTTVQGNAVLKQGSLNINADKLIFYGKLENGKAKSANKIVATGSPARFQQTPKENASPVKAVANTLEYSVKNETLFLIDKASLDQDGTSLSGNRIEYNVKDAIVKAGSISEDDEDVVRMVIPPKTIQTKD
ncbi:MAG: lipopolysaccharide export system protein LptA [Lentisphaeria bacterium]